MNILDTIIQHKLQEVEDRKKLYPVRVLEKSLMFNRPTASLKKAVADPALSGIIAEIKRQSPSKGVINENISVEDVANGYSAAGVSALSVLTDGKFFGGSNDDLTAARKRVSNPILRKDFVIDEYQIIEAKSIGADAILLIAAVLDAEKIKSFTTLAHSLKLDVLLEVHDEDEFLNNRNTQVDLVGVNNRNLKTFEVSIEISKRLSAVIPETTVKVSESGIDSVSAILELRQFGYQGFLIGQKFMECHSPEAACREFVMDLKQQV